MARPLCPLLVTTLSGEQFLDVNNTVVRLLDNCAGTDNHDRYMKQEWATRATPTHTRQMAEEQTLNPPVISLQTGHNSFAIQVPALRQRLHLQDAHLHDPGKHACHMLSGTEDNTIFRVSTPGKKCVQKCAASMLLSCCKLVDDLSRSVP